MTMLYTWGYATRTVKELIALVQANNIMAVVDVRKNPVSKKYPDFCRDRLEDFLREYKVKYVWASAISCGSKMELRNSENKFQYLELLLKELGNVLLLCAEKNPERCIRSYIARMMKERAGVPVVHL